jgi:hypothetical protein
VAARYPEPSAGAAPWASRSRRRARDSPARSISSAR